MDDIRNMDVIETDKPVLFSGMSLQTKTGQAVTDTERILFVDIIL